MKKQFFLIAAVILFSCAACSHKNVPENQNYYTEQEDGSGFFDCSGADAG